MWYYWPVGIIIAWVLMSIAGMVIIKLSPYHKHVYIEMKDYLHAALFGPGILLGAILAVIFHDKINV